MFGTIEKNIYKNKLDNPYFRVSIDTDTSIVDKIPYQLIIIIQ